MPSCTSPSARSGSTSGNGSSSLRRPFAARLSPWLLLIPAGFLAATMFAFNFIGDGLRDALDPRAR
jgi:ABC-type dipeptide/oligopeptide/nickel transport system permease subunit